MPEALTAAQQNAEANDCLLARTSCCELFGVHLLKSILWTVPLLVVKGVDFTAGHIFIVPGGEKANGRCPFRVKLERAAE